VREYLDRGMKKSILAVAVWYFVAGGNGVPLVQIGPFATQVACENNRTQPVISQNYFTAACFNTSAKQ
jgi:hypothetical protein